MPPPGALHPGPEREESPDRHDDRGDDQTVIAAVRVARPGGQCRSPSRELTAEERAALEKSAEAVREPMRVIQ